MGIKETKQAIWLPQDVSDDQDSWTFNGQTYSIDEAREMRNAIRKKTVAKIDEQIAHLEKQRTRYIAEMEAEN